MKNFTKKFILIITVALLSGIDLYSSEDLNSSLEKYKKSMDFRNTFYQCSIMNNKLTELLSKIKNNLSEYKKCTLTQITSYAQNFACFDASSIIIDNYRDMQDIQNTLYAFHCFDEHQNTKIVFDSYLKNISKALLSRKMINENFTKMFIKEFNFKREEIQKDFKEKFKNFDCNIEKRNLILKEGGASVRYKSFILIGDYYRLREKKILLDYYKQKAILINTSCFNNSDPVLTKMVVDNDKLNQQFEKISPVEYVEKLCKKLEKKMDKSEFNLIRSGCEIKNISEEFLSIVSQYALNIFEK